MKNLLKAILLFILGAAAVVEIPYWFSKLLMSIGIIRDFPERGFVTIWGCGLVFIVLSFIVMWIVLCIISSITDKLNIMDNKKREAWEDKIKELEK
jgi:Na+-transporting methylmalonyl-CoA/oxaloacetate decarboxylase gamma subunit